MKLIKIKEDYYVVVDDSEIREGDWVLTEENTIHQVDYVDAYTKINEWKKITHSTQPIEEFVDNEGIKRIGWTNIKVLELSEVKELIGEVDVESKVYHIVEQVMGNHNMKSSTAKDMINIGISSYNQAIEDNKDKKYTEEDLRKAMQMYKGEFTKGIVYSQEKIIQYFQPKTEWEVDFFDGKLGFKK